MPKIVSVIFENTCVWETLPKQSHSISQSHTSRLFFLISDKGNVEVAVMDFLPFTHVLFVLLIFTTAVRKLSMPRNPF